MSRTAVLAFRAAFVVLLALATWLSLTPSPIQVGPSDKLDHLAAYYVLALAADFAFPAAGFYLLKALPLFAYGVLMEVLQHYVPGRSAEATDAVADAAGILLFAASVPVLKRVSPFSRRWSGSTPP